MLLFCDVDEEGNIIEALFGATIIPSRQYDYFFYLKEKFEDISEYKVNIETRELVLK
jgi:hypothetical protein